jgi:hypothetical protein
MSESLEPIKPPESPIGRAPCAAPELIPLAQRACDSVGL